MFISCCPQEMIATDVEEAQTAYRWVINGWKNMRVGLAVCVRVQHEWCSLAQKAQRGQVVTACRGRRLCSRDNLQLKFSVISGAAGGGDAHWFIMAETFRWRFLTSDKSINWLTWSVWTGFSLMQAADARVSRKLRCVLCLWWDYLWERKLETRLLGYFLWCCGCLNSPTAANPHVERWHK